MTNLVAAVYCNPENRQQLNWIEPFSEGLMRHGVEVRNFKYAEKQTQDADIHLFWAMRAFGAINHCKERGQPFVCLDHGYTEDRQEITSVNLNGLNGQSELDVSSFSSDASRCQMHGWGVKEPQVLGENIIISGQVTGDKSLVGIEAYGDIYDWANVQIAELEKLGLGDRVLFKPHPREKPENLHRIATVNAPIFSGSMEEAYPLARLFVTYSSTVGPSAWLNGISASAESPVSMIYKEQFEDCTPENRQAWLNKISFRQFSKEEFRDGLAWELLGDRILGKAPAANPTTAPNPRPALRRETLELIFN